MHWLRRLLAGFLAVALAATAVVWVLDHTTWNSDYLQTTATQTHLADNLASALPDVAAQYVPAGPTRTALTSIITPSFVSDQLGQIIPEFVTAFRNDGPMPLLNLTGLNEQLIELGVPLPTSLNAILSTPQPLVPDNLATPLKTAGHTTAKLTWLAPLTALIAAVLLALVSGRGRFLTLAGGVLSGAGLTALAALLIQLPPRLIAAALGTSAARPLAPAIRSFAQTIAGDQTHQLLLIAIWLVVLAVILGVTHFILNLITHHRSRHPKTTDLHPSEI